MLRAVQSDRTSRLLDALAHDVARERASRSPLEPLVVVVPGRAFAAHVLQGLALRLGVAANLVTRSLRGVLADGVAATHPGLELAGPEATAAALVELLHRPEVLGRAGLEPVRRYLDVPDRDASDRRRVDLAGRLGALFEAYAFERPDLLGRWGRPRRSSATAVGVEVWQELLYRALVEDEGAPFRPVLPEPRGPGRRWLPSDALERIERWVVPGPLFLFAVPLGSEVMARAVDRLAETAAVHVYALHPSRAPRDEPPGAGLGSGATAPRGPPERWHRHGREEARLLAALAGGAVEDRAAPSEGPPRHLLDAVQRHVLGGPIRPEEGRFQGDESLVLLEAPGIRRECEAIAREIREQVEGSSDLRWSDVVVALATSEAEIYRSQLAAAFAEMGDIPFHELDVRVASRSPVFDAVQLLLALPGSRYTRQDLLRILSHPSVRARHGLGDTDAWTAWCERLGIVHGADHGDHAGTYIEKDLFNWDQGLRRLALGAFVAGEGLGRTAPVVLSGVPWAPVDFSADEVSAASSLIALARSLIGDARALAAAELSMSEWVEYARAVVETYVGASSPEDERDLLRVHGALDGLGRAFRTSTPVRFATLASLLGEKLADMRTQRGAALAEGVVVAPLHEVAGLPFRVAFVPGLGEGKFPAPERASSLDLRERRDARGRDEHAFLLRLITTTDALRLSYVARDARSGDPLAPSSTLAELIALLEQSHVGEGRAPRRIEPLRRHDAPGPSVGARAEQGAIALRESLRSTLGPRRRFPGLDDLERSLPSATWRLLERRLGLPQLRDGERPGPSPRVRLSNLRRFLEDPLQGWARQVLGLSNTDLLTDPLARTDELFELDRATTTSLLRETFLDWTARGDPPARLTERYLAAAERLELSGALPTGVFGEATRRRHLSILEAWRLRLAEALEGRASRLGRWALGHPGAPVGASTPRPGLELESGIVVGTSEPLLESGGAFVLAARPIDDDRGAIREELKVWLTQIVVTAAGEASDRPWPALVAHPGERLHRAALAPLSAERAHAVLDGLVRDLLHGDHAHLLPFETQLRLHAGRARGWSARRLGEVLASARPDPYGPLDAIDVAPPSVELALEIVERRLGPFLDARLAGGAAR